MSSNNAPECENANLLCKKEFDGEIVSLKAVSKSIELDVYWSRRTDMILSAYFIIVGMNALLVWNMVINVFVSFQSVIWPEQNFADLLGGIQKVMAVLATVLYFHPKMKPLTKRGMRWCGVFNALFCLIFPMVPQFFSGNENLMTAKILLSLCVVILGVLCGLSQIYGFAYSTIFPAKTYLVYCSGGNGIAGIYSFFVYLFFSTVVFDMSLSDQKKLVWTLFVAGGLVSAVQVVLWEYVIRMRSFKDAERRIAACKEQKDEESQKTDRGSLLVVVKKTALFGFSLFFTFLTTLTVFPVIGPFSWRFLSPNWMTLMNGIFQVGDFISRFIPVLGSWTHFSPNVTLCLTAVRPFIFLPLFLVAASYCGSGSETGCKQGLLDNEWLLAVVMLFFVLSNGWLVSLNTLYTVMSTDEPQEKDIAANIMVLWLLLGIAIGIFSSGLWAYAIY